MVAKSFSTKEVRRYWLWDNPPADCPIPFGPNDAYIAYLASAEIGCHLALGWRLPYNVIDLYAEFRCLTSGRPTIGGRGLLGALQNFGLAGVDATHKDAMRHLAVRGGPFSAEEQQSLLSYCETDVIALEQLLPRMLPLIDLPRALIRGRYMAAAANVERTGIPIDTELLTKINANWEGLKHTLVREMDHDGIYESTTFKIDRWERWLTDRKITWPRLSTGSLDLKRETFREMSRLHSEVQPIGELRTTLSHLRLNDLAVGGDGRNRYMVGAFGAKTGRNTPSNSKAIFGPAKWIRHLIKPTEGMALAYIDWGQQELGIAAKLSGDTVMQSVYLSEDPYLAFARLAGAVPDGATKSSHAEERAIYKICALAVLMGMGPQALGRAIGGDTAMGHRLLRQHKDRFPLFWRWSNNQVDKAMLGEPLIAAFGWKLQPELDGPTTFRNFLLQANGAEMLRLAAIAITERQISLCALVHDAVLIEAPLGEIEAAVNVTRECMASASRAVLGGFTLATEFDIIRWPHRFHDARGGEMWNTVHRLLTTGQHASN